MPGEEEEDLINLGVAAWRRGGGADTVQWRRGGQSQAEGGGERDGASCSMPLLCG